MIEEKNLLIFLSFVAPSASPNLFSVRTISPRNATLSWTPPEEGQRNGIIIGYTVACVDDSSFRYMLTTTDLTAMVTGLNPSSHYMCNVSASTGAGSSPAASLNFTTATAGKGVFAKAFLTLFILP